MGIFSTKPRSRRSPAASATPTTASVRPFTWDLSREILPQETGYRYDGENKEWLQIVTRGSVSLKFPIRDADSGHNVSVGYNILHAKPREEPAVTLDPRGEIPEVPSQYFRAGLSLGWDYSNFTSSPLGIGAHKGRALGLDIDLYHPAFGGSQKITTFAYRWTEYVPMPWLSYHTLVLSFSGAAKISDPPNQVSYSVGGQSASNLLDTIIKQPLERHRAAPGICAGNFQGKSLPLTQSQLPFPHLVYRGRLRHTAALSQTDSGLGFQR